MRDKAIENFLKMLIKANTRVMATGRQSITQPIAETKVKVRVVGK